ncbi:MAG: hypothetical protein NWF08_05570 [Candidatus Bathyarchaeota archaeon]|nr:hypothetical protein [Candidatus Bathyarchaeota archaeon]
MKSWKIGAVSGLIAGIIQGIVNYYTSAFVHAHATVCRGFLWREELAQASKV